MDHQSLRHFLVFFVYLSTLSISVYGFERRTKYGCEGTHLDIECDEGTVINLVRANFGRFSISICNDHGNTSWSVNCMEPRTLRIVNRECSGKPRCTIDVDKAIFGDPCPGTHKYVEVHYNCIPARRKQQEEATPKALPPWFLDLSATPASIAKKSSTTLATTKSTTTTISSTTLSSSTEISTESSTFFRENAYSTSESNYPVADIEATAVEQMDVEDNINWESTVYHTITEEEGEINLLQNLANHCPPQTVRNLFWNWTRSGEEAILMCPQGTTGFARWSCGQDAAWRSQSPNLGECQSSWLTRLEAQLQNTGSAAIVSAELVTGLATKSLYGGDISLVAKLLRGFAHFMRQELFAMSSQQAKEHFVTGVLQNVLKAVSNVLSEPQMLAWEDLNDGKSASVANALMIGVEDNAILLADIVNNERNLDEVTQNILATVRVLRSREVQDQIFPGPYNTVHLSESAQIDLPAASLVENSVNGAVRIAFFLYDTLDTLLPATKSGIQFVNSKIIGATVSKGRNVYLSQPLTVTLRHLESQNVHGHVCVNWDYSSRTWTTDGCQLIESDKSHTTCQCSYLSYYAVLSEEVPVNVISSSSHAQNDHLNAETHHNSSTSQEEMSSFIVTLVACLVALIGCIIFVLIGFIVMKRNNINWHPRQLNKLFSENGRLQCFLCKKNDSNTSSKNSNGFYPALNSSPASTTLSSNTTPNTTTNTLSSSKYFDQFWNQGDRQCYQIHPQQAVPQTLKLSQQHQQQLQQQQQQQQQQMQQQQYYQQHQSQPTPKRFPVLYPNQQQQQQQVVTLSGPIVQQSNPMSNPHLFRPVSPHGHIYMEIDPVYAFHQQQKQQQQQQQFQETSETQSDIQLSDLSDDDLRRNSDISRQSSNRYCEERPLIRNPLRLSVPATAHNGQQRHCMTSVRGQKMSQHNQPAKSISTNSLRTNQKLRQPIYPISGLDTPITVTLQGGDQFVSLKIDNEQQLQQQLQQQQQAPVHKPQTGLIFSDI